MKLESVKIGQKVRVKDSSNSTPSKRGFVGVVKDIFYLQNEYELSVCVIFDGEWFWFWFNHEELELVEE